MKGRESGMPDDSFWETFFNPRCILERMDCVGPCGDVVEFGCGYGTFTVPAAESITGSVFALDIESDMVGATAQRFRHFGFALTSSAWLRAQRHWKVRLSKPSNVIWSANPLPMPSSASTTPAHHGIQSPKCGPPTVVAYFTLWPWPLPPPVPTYTQRESRRMISWPSTGSI